MTRKRAPGGGRKPKGEFAAKASTFSTRITPDLRKALDHEAMRNSRSLSQEVERRLRDSIKQSKAQNLEAQHQWALAQLVSQLVRRIEILTGERWPDNAFTCKAVGIGVNILLDRLGPTMSLEVPARIDENCRSLEDLKGERANELAAQQRTPGGLAAGVALGLLDQVEKANPLSPPYYGSDDELLLTRIKARLGIRTAKTRGRKD